MPSSALAAIVLAVALPGAALAQPRPLARGDHARCLGGGWGTAWRYGVPGYGKTTSDVRFVAVHPGLGWFVADRAELFGEAAVFVYFRQPQRAIAVGPIAAGARYHFRQGGSFAPFVSAGAGLIVVSLDVPELDRRFNGQLFYGGGVRWLRERGPHWRLELRNHHISNAGTAGQNLGLNAFMAIVAAEWFLRR